MEVRDRVDVGPLPALAAWGVVAATAAGLAATYWDDSWHTFPGV
ncbi:hypothetical protein [Kibdelosporangium persicum]|nr:hypothetical protein [Kibdelosporangium persicum]